MPCAVKTESSSSALRGLTMWSSLQLTRKTMLLVFTQHASPGTLMTVRMRHAYHRINSCNEVWTHAGLFGRKHCQVSSGRETHHANLLRIDMILVGMLANIGYGLLNIVERVWVLMPSEEKSSVRDVWHDTLHAILQHEGRDAFRLQPFGHFSAFCLHSMPTIRATRADDNRRGV